MSLNNDDFIVIDHNNPRYLTFAAVQALQELCASHHIFLDRIHTRTRIHTLTPTCPHSHPPPPPPPLSIISQIGVS